MLTVGKLHGQLELTTLPDGLVLAGNTALPVLEVEDTLRVASWSRVKPERVVSAPELAVGLVSKMACGAGRLRGRRTAPPEGGSGRETWLLLNKCRYRLSYSLAGRFDQSRRRKACGRCCRATAYGGCQCDGVSPRVGRGGPRRELKRCWLGLDESWVPESLYGSEVTEEMGK